jgi:opacity protein-like surface antigen
VKVRVQAGGLALAALLLSSGAAAQSTVDQKIDVLQKEIDRLKEETKRLKDAQSAPASAPVAAQKPADASGAEQPATTIFGYGEFNYNHYRDPDLGSKADLRRFVFGFGHRFNDQLTFNSEVEFEHGVVSADDQGEAEIEQAYLNYQFSDAVNVKGGLFLIPLGILNLTHEPPTYYGVERNEVETRIIPTTWRELGVGMHGLLSTSWQYDLGLTTGFNAAKLDDPAFGVRTAHQEGQLADAYDLSVYGALNYRAPGLLIGGGVFTGNTGQNGQSDPLFKGIAGKLTLWDIHAKYSVAGWDLQALYAAGRLGDAAQLNEAGLARAAADPSFVPFAYPKSMKGWYGQAAYHAYRKGNLDVAPFVRFERFEILQQEDAANGLFQDPKNVDRVQTIGVNFQIHPQVVIKTDVQHYQVDSSKNRFNIGLGYMF